MRLRPLSTPRNSAAPRCLPDACSRAASSSSAMCKASTSTFPGVSGSAIWESGWFDRSTARFIARRRRARSTRIWRITRAAMPKNWARLAQLATGWLASPKVRLVDEQRRLQGFTKPLAPDVGGGDTPEFGIDRRDDAFTLFRRAAPVRQHRRQVVHRRFNHVKTSASPLPRDRP